MFLDGIVDMYWSLIYISICLYNIYFMVLLICSLKLSHRLNGKCWKKISGDDGPNGTSPMACQISQEFHHFWMVKILEQDLFVVFERQFLCSLYPHIYCLSQVFVGRKMLQFVSLLFLEKKKNIAAFLLVKVPFLQNSYHGSRLQHRFLL